MRPLSQAVLALLLAAGWGCGRNNALDEGAYVLSVIPGDVFRDDCGLAADGGPSLQAQFTKFGQDVRLALVQQSAAQCLAVELVGQFQLNNQNFFADGTATNPPLVSGGRVCQVNFIQVHLDATTADAASFNGVMRISYLASSPVSCNCQFWFNYRAAMCTPPACPPVPTECS